MKTANKNLPLRHYLLFITLSLSTILIISIAVGYSEASSKIKQRSQWAYPKVPRVSVTEAYAKVRAGKAILIQAEGQPYSIRHVQGALFGIPTQRISERKRLPKLPKRGVEILTYCY